MDENYVERISHDDMFLMKSWFENICMVVKIYVILVNHGLNLPSSIILLR